MSKSANLTSEGSGWGNASVLVRCFNERDPFNAVVHILELGIFILSNPKLFALIIIQFYYVFVDSIVSLLSSTFKNAKGMWMICVMYFASPIVFGS